MLPLVALILSCSLRDGPGGDAGVPPDTGDTGSEDEVALALALGVESAALAALLADIAALPLGADGVRDPEATRAYGYQRLSDVGFTVEEWSFATDGTWNTPCGDDATCAGVNLLATWPAAPDEPCLMVGAHLDAWGGPGVNDNGSGMAAVVEIARLAAAQGLTEAAPLCFALWDQEEVGMLGSTAWVAGVSVLVSSDPPPGPAVEGVLAYLNLDMLGSINGVPGLQELDGPHGTSGWSPPGSEVVNEAVEGWFLRDGRQPAYLPRSGHSGSDHVPFIAAELPVAWLFSGAGDLKTTEQAQAYGGSVGVPMDPCYHESCDDLGNVDPELHLDLTRAAAWTVASLAGRESLSE